MTDDHKARARLTAPTLSAASVPETPEYSTGIRGILSQGPFISIDPPPCIKEARRWSTPMTRRPVATHGQLQKGIVLVPLHILSSHLTCPRLPLMTVMEEMLPGTFRPPP